MNYELAKQLKEAGFPLKASMYDAFASGESFMFEIPTLSELIEACGNGFTSLEKTIDGKWMTNWNKERARFFSIGDTPEEAVGSMWLVLNKIING